MTASRSYARQSVECGYVASRKKNHRLATVATLKMPAFKCMTSGG